MKNIFRTFFVCVLVNHILNGQPEITKRVGLVIGVQSYTIAPPLKHSLNDAHDMATILKSKGFSVIELYDPKTKREIKDAILQYYNELKDHPEIAALFYYSGHGLQVDGSNYLIPTHANPQIKADLDDQCLKMDYVTSALEEAGNSLNIIILDACRTNPFASFTRSSEAGLNMVTAPKGAYIIYATKPGSVASDGTGRNGLFTSKLLKYIDTPDLNIETVFKKVAQDVSNASNEQQRPWIASDYTGDFFFTPSSGGNTSPSNSNAATNSLPDQQATDQKQTVDLETLKVAAAKGDPIALFNLGVLYETGQGVTKSEVTAASWYKKSADRGGYPPAENNLGMMYENGTGVEKDLGEAVRLYRLAANQGYTFAEFNLGAAYQLGKGVPVDYSEALHWYMLAAQQGDISSQLMTGYLYLLNKDEKSAMRWYHRAALRGNANGQYNLGVLHQNQMEYEKAFRWYLKAADQGLEKAQFNLAFLYEYGKGVGANSSEAMKWYRKAADQGNSEARDALNRLEKK